jgi:hypothetical protein
VVSCTVLVPTVRLPVLPTPATVTLYCKKAEGAQGWSD